MSLNINNKSSLVNNSNEEFNYFTLNKKVFNELILIPRPKNTLFQIMCRIPDDCIDKNRYPLFMARSVLRELIESLPSTRSL